MSTGPPARSVVLVEGESDRIALEALARRRGRDLRAEGVQVIDIGGATNIRKFLRHYQGELHLSVAGLCDESEAPDYARALGAAGRPGVEDGSEMEALGFFVCRADLEDELIRALGTDAVIAVVAANGELDAFRTMQQQPAQRGRTVEAQLHRFIGTKSGRKARYARALVDALDPAQTPRPLAGLLEHL
jgi:hypothetical protein